MIHRIIGGIVLLGWFWLMFHLGRFEPKLVVASGAHLGRAGRGVLYVAGMPLLAAALLIFPDAFARRFSPYSHVTGEPLLDTGFWRLAGYFTLLVAIALLALFR